MSTDSQFFTFSRLSLLARKNLVEDWRSILLSCAGLFGLLVLIGILVSHFCYDEYVQPENYSTFCNYRFFMWVLIIMFGVGAYVASIAFRTMKTAPAALSTLMVPASQFEKYALRWLVAVPLFLLLLFVAAYIADWIRVGYASAYYEMEVRPLPWGNILFDPEAAGYFKGFTSMGLLIYLCIQSFFLLGAIVWSRHSMLKTFVSCGVLIFLYVGFGAWIFTTFQNDGAYFYSGPEFFDNQDNMMTLIRIFLGLTTLLNYWLAYRRFRESEIINRW